MARYKYYKAVATKAMVQDAPLLIARTTRYSRVFNTRSIKERIAQQEETVQAIKQDAYNLFISGYINQEQYNDYLTNIPTVAKPTVAQLANTSVYRAEMWNRYYNPDTRDVGVYMTNEYLMSDIWYYFSQFAPTASQVLERIAYQNPSLFAELVNEGRVPTEWNVSDWDNITADILRDYDIYDDVEQEAMVLAELDNWQDIVHEKRPWASKK